MARRLRLDSPRQRAQLTHGIDALDEFGATRTVSIPGRARADGLRRQARAGHADDAGRRARTAGARLSAQPAPGRVGRRGRVDHRRLGRQRRGGEDARRHRALRREDRQAGRHHRLRAGHDVRRPDGRRSTGSRCRRPTSRRRASAQGALYAAARRDAAPGEHLQVGRVGARLRALPPGRTAAPSSRTSGATTRSTRSPAGCGCTAWPAATRSSTRPAG